MCRSLVCVLFLTALPVRGADIASSGPGVEPPVERLTKSYFSKFFLRYTPDGSHIAYCRQDANRRASNRILVGLRIVKADGTDDRPVLSDFDKEVQIQEHPVFTPDGKGVLVSGGGNDVGNSSKDVFLADLDESYKGSKLRKLVPGAGVGLGEEPSLSPDGKQLAFVTINEQLWVCDADGKNKASVVQVSGSYCHQPDWSPDGEWIAFASDRDGNIEIYKVRPDGTELTRLTDESGIDSRPRWSPDGEWILFTSNRRGNQDLFIMRADGRELRPLTTHPATDDSGCWHPSGKSIAFVSMRDGGFDIYQVAVPSGLRVAAAPRPRAKEEGVNRHGVGLVARYDFEGVTDARVPDVAGRSHAALAGGARIVSESGKSSVELDGKGAHVVCGNADPLRLSRSMTLSLRVRPVAFGGNGYLISKHGWNIYIGSDGKPRFETRNGADTVWDTLESSSPLKPGEWNHVAAALDSPGKSIAVYVNGVKTGERARPDGAIGSVVAHPVHLGHYTVSKTQAFAGRLDEVRVYRGALSAEDVAKEHAAQRELVVP